MGGAAAMESKVAAIAPDHAGAAARNPGAFLFTPAFIGPTEIAELAALAREVAGERRSIATSQRYGSIRWYEVPLDPAHDICARLIAHLGVPTPNLLAFYYLEPGAILHPHRDLTGAGLNNRIRFHLPIITNPDVEFRVSGQRIRMEPGDLWCLDTSYLHAVRNDGAESRVHIVVECDITSDLRRKLPHGPAARLHDAWFVAVLAGQFVKAVTRNAIFNPRYFVGQMKMVARFIGWRFLKIGEPR